jgi:hypothetical protein
VQLIPLNFRNTIYVTQNPKTTNNTHYSRAEYMIHDQLFFHLKSLKIFIGLKISFKWCLHDDISSAVFLVFFFYPVILAVNPYPGII